MKILENELILNNDIYFDVVGKEEGILVEKGSYIKKVSEKTEDSIEVANSFLFSFEEDKVFVGKGEIIEIIKKDENSEGDK